jgi:hypothetical protein
VKLLVEQEFRSRGHPTTWAYARDGANAKRILRALDAQKDLLPGGNPVEAIRLALHAFLGDPRAERRGFPLTWFWKEFDGYLRAALRARQGNRASAQRQQYRLVNFVSDGGDSHGR